MFGSGRVWAEAVLGLLLFEALHVEKV